MSIAGVVGWTSLVVLLFMLAASFSAAARPGLTQDLVNLQFCFSLAFAVATVGMVRMHLPTRDALDAAGARPAPWWLLGLAALLGVVLQVPALWLDGAITAVWPLTDEELARQATMFAFQSPGHKVAFALAAALVGPLFEEVFCRGVMFRALHRSWPGGLTVALTTGAFAFLHLDARYAANAALCGLALGLLRLWSGTVWVSLIAHVAFNSVTTLALLQGWVKAGERDTPLPASWGIAGTAALLLLLAVARALAARSDVVLEAREEDKA